MTEADMGRSFAALMREYRETEEEIILSLMADILKESGCPDQRAEEITKELGAIIRQGLADGFWHKGQN